MNKDAFLTQHANRLRDFCRMSKAAGSRSDYVQGGGGNTSCKLDEHLMAIKASGYPLGQIQQDQAYAVLNYPKLRRFFGDHAPTDFKDVETAGAECTKEAIETIDGLPQLKPSVESGFHAMLEPFVLHTHPVYANLVTCAREGEAIAAEALADLGETYAFVPYINPGARLTFEIARIREAVLAKQGKLPAILFMENHGLIVSGDDAEFCLKLHDRVNERLAAAFDLDFAVWPRFELAKAGDLFLSQTDTLQRCLRRQDWQLEQFTEAALYPDQLVFLYDQLAVVEKGRFADWQGESEKMPAKATLFRESGEVAYHCGRSEAMTIEETLYAVFFIRDHIAARGLSLRLMDDASKAFIMNWDSEHYRKKIAAES